MRLKPKGGEEDCYPDASDDYLAIVELASTGKVESGVRRAVQLGQDDVPGLVTGTCVDDDDDLPLRAPYFPPAGDLVSVTEAVKTAGNALFAAGRLREALAKWHQALAYCDDADASLRCVGPGGYALPWDAGKIAECLPRWRQSVTAAEGAAQKLVSEAGRIEAMIEGAASGRGTKRSAPPSSPTSPGDRLERVNRCRLDLANRCGDAVSGASSPDDHLPDPAARRALLAECLEIVSGEAEAAQRDAASLTSRVAACEHVLALKTAATTRLKAARVGALLNVAMVLIDVDDADGAPDTASVREGYGAARLALKAEPGNAKALFRCGLAQMRLGHFDHATDFLLQAARLKPEDRVVQRQLELCKALKRRADKRLGRRYAAAFGGAAATASGTDGSSSEGDT